MLDKIYDLIEPEISDSKKSFSVYDWFMMVTIIVSIIPLAFHSTNVVFTVIDKITVIVFIVDYILRLITADKKLGKGVKSFFVYPFTPMAIIDLVSILPSVSVLSNGFKLLKIFRLFRTFRVLRAFKFIRYSKSIDLIICVLKKQSRTLITVVVLAFAYVLISALIVFNVEPTSFDTFFDALYWATVSLTTMGYGDIYPVTTIGRVVTMVSSIFGIAIVALPSGIITAGFMEELNNTDTDEENKE